MLWSTGTSFPSPPPVLHRSANTRQTRARTPVAQTALRQAPTPGILHNVRRSVGGQRGACYSSATHKHLGAEGGPFVCARRAACLSPTCARLPSPLAAWVGSASL